MVIWSVLRVGQYRYDDHQDDAPHFTFTDERYKDSDREKQKIEAKIKKMRSSTSCWRSNNNDGERLKEYLASRDKMNEVLKYFGHLCLWYSSQQSLKYPKY